MTDDLLHQAFSETKQKSKRKESGMRKIIKSTGILLGIAGVIGLLVFGVIFAVKQKPEWFGITATVEENQNDIAELINEVNKVILLPEGEAPSIAEVTDPVEARKQEFFKKAEAGDKVLVYKEAKKAYLYRPSEKRIIEVGQILINEEQSIDSSEPGIAEQSLEELLKESESSPSGSSRVLLQNEKDATASGETR
jgi:hypothetical protein